MDSNLPIGLNPQSALELAKGLNDLLADLQIFHQNVRGFHWNIRGNDFFELHFKFEELYTDLQIKIDEVAERILTLDARPLHDFEDYLKTSDVPVIKDITNGSEAMRHCVAAFSVLLVRERAILQLSSQSSDEGTNALMSDYIREQEKQVWMFRAYLG
ncbi:MAG: DNA starvation/stationary phase protection protein [Flavobacteriales bacterium]|jgi:starvation-inducible DNA-binding protein|nr:DNA starvation/stationary phase protection protein [Flavobacteriales bacterium]